MTLEPAHKAEDGSEPPTRFAPGVRLVKGLDQTLGLLDRVLLWVCSLLFVSVVGVVLASVFFRYVLNASLSWGEELARYLSIWLVFLGLACAHRRSEHPALQSLLGRIPGINPEVARRIGEFITVIVSFAVVWYGTEGTAANFDRNQVSPALQIQIAWAYLAIPVGFALMGLQGIVRMFSTVPPPPADPELEEI
ncbi:TRAP transporter small permease [Pseudarthrobacter sp. NamE2]|uniref:TRAP transporter small permease n=1 Tax=Pseudarthrobacter sp. NamE2 TaxID=2576838 RepID=UPI0010FD9F46|nr:TRAP transporter small permease [Pseudarthrobacter sp. NamE2]TLM86604.1 TRAP transporter small permease [Pseudarthrobacter sp. NamE2]